MFLEFDWQQFWGAFFVLFAIIDIPGSIPLIISMRKKGKIIKPVKAAVLAFIMFMIFSVFSVQSYGKKVNKL